MIITPRGYQRTARAKILDAFREFASTLVVMPTGTGKTILFADVIRCFFPRRVMVIANRQELIFQARDKIKDATGLSVEVEMGDSKAIASGGLFRRSAVVVSTIQTLTAGGDGGGRMGKFDPNEFGLLVCDEAHHFVSPSFRRAVEYFRTNTKLKVLGVTATPDRADEEALGQVFESVAYDYEILDAINDGWLVTIMQQMVSVADLDLSNVRVTAGDLNGADLAAIFESERNLHGVAGPTIDIVGDRRTLVFTSSVKHAEQLAAIFNRHKPGMAKWVCGKTDKNERAYINQEFHDGKLQILCNCGTHTEGFDSPGVECVVMARPTKSRSLYAQMVGRSTRPLPGVVDDCEDRPEARREAIARSAKPSCLVVDFVGNAGRHQLVTTADILGGNVSEEAVAAAATYARRNGGPVPMDALLEEAQRQQEEREKRRLEEEARKRSLTVKTQYTSQVVDPFAILNLPQAKSRGWDAGKVLSEKQRNFLRRSGVDPDKMEYAKAKALIGELMNRWDKHLCTFGQAKVLKRFGVSTDLTFEQASKTIDAIAKNHWKLPQGFVIPVPTAEVCSNTAAEEDNVPF